MHTTFSVHNFTLIRVVSDLQPYPQHAHAQILQPRSNHTQNLQCHNAAFCHCGDRTLGREHTPISTMTRCFVHYYLYLTRPILFCLLLIHCSAIRCHRTNLFLFLYLGVPGACWPRGLLQQRPLLSIRLALSARYVPGVHLQTAAYYKLSGVQATHHI